MIITDSTGHYAVCRDGPGRITTGPFRRRWTAWFVALLPRWLV